MGNPPSARIETSQMVLTIPIRGMVVIYEILISEMQNDPTLYYTDVRFLISTQASTVNILGVKELVHA
jgi:hypothetical protein